jgi:sulfate transport system substrate-binding protein
VAGILRNVPILDTGARGATVTFVERGIGDVLLAWENEALMAVRQLKPDALEIVMPPVSIRAEPAVAWVDRVTARRGTQAAAQAYLEFLYTPEAQEVAARHFYRPRLESVAARYADRFPKIDLFTVEEVFGGWSEAHAAHFADGGLFDQVVEAR